MQPTAPTIPIAAPAPVAAPVAAPVTQPGAITPAVGTTKTITQPSNISSGPTTVPSTPPLITTAKPAQTQFAGLSGTLQNILGQMNQPISPSNYSDAYTHALTQATQDNDAATKALVTSIQSSRVSSAAQAADSARRVASGLQLKGIETGEAQSAAPLLSQHQQEVENNYTQQLQSINAQATKALTDAQQAQQNNNLGDLKDAMDYYQQLNSQKQDILKTQLSAYQNQQDFNQKAYEFSQTQADNLRDFRAKYGGLVNDDGTLNMQAIGNYNLTTTIPGVGNILDTNSPNFKALQSTDPAAANIIIQSHQATTGLNPIDSTTDQGKSFLAASSALNTLDQLDPGSTIRSNVAGAGKLLGFGTAKKISDLFGTGASSLPDLSNMTVGQAVNYFQTQAASADEVPVSTIQASPLFANPVLAKSTYTSLVADPENAAVANAALQLNPNASYAALAQAIFQYQNQNSSSVSQSSDADFKNPTGQFYSNLPSNLE